MSRECGAAPQLQCPRQVGSTDTHKKVKRKYSCVTTSTRRLAAGSPPRAYGRLQSLGTAASAEFLLALQFQTSENGLETLLRKIILTTSVVRNSSPPFKTVTTSCATQNQKQHIT